jgi:23S rRNA (adenine2030-N6)-methyltransferase
LNYRHSFHAGNFADVFKHALLVPLVRGLQRKEKGFLFLDTHAGAGAYNLNAAPSGRTLEYVDGIGRLWARAEVPPGVREYLELVRQFNASRGALGETLRFYPGSPRLALALLRAQDRLALSELHPDDCETLRTEFARDRGVNVQCIDAYSALRAFLPPPERRALVLIDPPYEDHNEVVRIHAALTEVLERFPAGTYVIWYPIKERAGAGAFKSLLATLPLPPTLAAEITVYANDPPDRLNGCGLLVLNPPWQIADELAPLITSLRDLLALEPGAHAGLEWLRDES